MHVLQSTPAYLVHVKHLTFLLCGFGTMPPGGFGAASFVDGSTPLPTQKWGERLRQWQRR